ncbi:cellobiose phosphorylase [bacterium]|nr:MAG: cellobiose phosphorylase [bacterium]
MKNLKDKKIEYYLDPQSGFTIENYNLAKSFANFFPGIAGKYGIPLWVFYVNRGQGIISFGIKDKDHSILEFLPANKAWQLVSSQGFRTFIKIFQGKKSIFYEPFHNDYLSLQFNLKNKMCISSYDLRLQEVNFTLGLKTSVQYFTIPEDSYAGLVRIVKIQNTGKTKRRIQLIDGLPQIIPFGTSNLFLKRLSRTIEAWMKVENLQNKVPFYRLAVDPTDRPEVIRIKEGNFYLGFHYAKNQPEIIKPIVNPQSVFGPVTDFSYPRNFLLSAEFKTPANEVISSATPSALLHLDLELSPKEEKTFYVLSGYMRSIEKLNCLLPKIISRGYITQKEKENQKIIQDLQSQVATQSSSPALDLYAQQTYLDNIMRGGYPIVFKSNSGSPVFYLYCRKHGDLERDYNKFQLQATYFSQGNGNYRDMNQNRRCDIWFNPQIKDDNLINFFSLLQPDGFNPLVVKGVYFTIKEGSDLKNILDILIEEKDIPVLMGFLAKPFTPGDLILFIEENNICTKVSYDELLDLLLPSCLKNQEAEHGEGFWTDHWTYNLDLLEQYLGVYPEDLKEIALEKRAFTFYDNTEIVRPRKDKYLLKEGLVRQFHAVAPDNAKREMIRKRTDQPHLVRTEYGQGKIYRTTLFNKLLCLLANKFASLDPFGIGIEMEADKPNWFDALNGLPGLLGSSLCETLELKRLSILINEIIKKTKIDKIFITEEIYRLLVDLNNLTQEYFKDATPENDYKFWDKSHLLKEDYCHKTRFGFSGNEVEIASYELLQIIENTLNKIDLGIAKARTKEAIYITYFINEVTEYETIKEHFVRPLKFTQKRLPLFLESQMHALRLSGNRDTALAQSIYSATKKSELYDKKLKMYKVTAPLNSMPEEIGRCRVFEPGWLENESIWMHMEYKYLLETLKMGLTEEFYSDFKNVLVPFQDPARYGRSILENSSFIVSSAFPDKNLHGNGFVARLSGSTVEFLNIWLLMNLGKQPFFVNEKNELNLRFSPLLAGWLFNPKTRSYAFNFLGKIWVVYRNPKRENTFGKNGARAVKINFNDREGNAVEIPSDTIPHPYAEQIRSLQIKQIDIDLG